VVSPLKIKRIQKSDDPHSGTKGFEYVIDLDWDAKAIFTGYHALEYAESFVLAMAQFQEDAQDFDERMKHLALKDDVLTHVAFTDAEPKLVPVTKT